jgi:plastocyanin
MNALDSRKLTRRDLLRAATGLAALATTATLAACGGASAKERSVKMTAAMTFDPPALTVNVGETVTWRNDSAMVHTVTADPAALRDPSLIELPPGAAPWDSGNIGIDESWSYTFATPGRYRYVCVPHVIAGMVGEITVELS